MLPLKFRVYVVIVAFLIQASILYWLNPSQALYYFSFAVLGITLWSKAENVRISGLLLPIAILFSLVVNPVPAVFQPVERFIGFLCVYSVVGPLFLGRDARRFRLALFLNFNNLLIIFVILSFFTYFIPHTLFFYRGGFKGLFCHSMTLGPLAGITFILLLHRIVHEKQHGWLWPGLRMLLCLACCILAASRGAIVALVVAVSFYSFTSIGIQRKKLFGIIFLFVALLALSSSLWLEYANPLIGKVLWNLDQGSVFYTRENAWALLYREFLNNPLTGIGFMNFSYWHDEFTGSVESGSSWMHALATLGGIGFLPFLWLMIRPFVILGKSYREVPSRTKCLMAILLFWELHMIGEGYILSCGNAIFIYCWLCVAVANDRADRWQRRRRLDRRPAAAVPQKGLSR